MYISACPETGMCLRIAFHDGSHKTLVEKVRDASEGLRQRGRVIVVDNFYVTMDLMKWALDEGIHILGTVQANRIPQSQMWTLDARAPRGMTQAHTVALSATQSN